MNVLLLELDRRQIAEGRVQPLLIIDRFEKMADGSSRFRHRLIFAQVHLFVFEGLHEAFCLRVVIRIAASAHADAELMLFEYEPYPKK